MKPRALLNKTYALLSGKFGPGNWWPIVKNGRPLYLPEYLTRERTPAEIFEIAVGAILTQNTSWGNVVLAIDNLKRAKVMSRKGISDTPLDTLAEMIKPSGYFNQKAKKLKALIYYIDTGLKGSLSRLREFPPDRARESLLSVWGVGKETADSILLYGLGMPVFVIDAYTRRIFSRMGAVDKDADYDAIRAYFEKHTGRDINLYREFHALVVAQGKDVCKNKPLCDACVLNKICPASGGENR
jgi:endonuclease-3 related protein